MLFVNATSPWANKNCVMSVKKCGGQTAYHDHVHQANQNKSEQQQQLVYFKNKVFTITDTG
jgi:hypothetical protein